ncbi:uncharacterized protein LOC126210544 [Schistocerca nitens]|uniref:uncharacterized protein LOC126210544 n=1 Tax=Schistocerca nitens TaxID=7011 RepID=UPI002118A3DF|nr:uncharacterized protein LOC126210544 [Schistocerca nitens]
MLLHHRRPQVRAAHQDVHRRQAGRRQLYGINSDKIPKGPKLIRECGEKVLCNYFMYLGYYKGWINRIIYNNTLTDTDSTPLSTRHPIIHGTEGGIRAAAAATAACPLLHGQ